MTSSGPLSARSILARLQRLARGDWSLFNHTHASSAQGGTISAAPNGSAGGDLAGTYPNPTVAQIAAALTFANTLSPSTLSADQNDYNPTGLSSANTVSLSASTAVNVTGIAGGSTGRLLLLVNAGANPITFKHQSASSGAGNRFYFARLGDVTIHRGQYLLLRHSTFWQAVTAVEAGTNGVSGLVRIDNDPTHVLAGDGTMKAGEFTANKNVAGGYAGLDADGLLPVARLPIIPLTTTLTGTSTTINDTTFDLEAASTLIFPPRRTALGSSPGHLAVYATRDDTLQIDSTDGSDDGTVEILVMGVPL